MRESAVLFIAVVQSRRGSNEIPLDVMHSILQLIQTMQHMLQTCWFVQFSKLLSGIRQEACARV